MRVAAASTICFVLYFGFVDARHMLVEAIVLACVGLGMMIVTHRYSLDFSQLIVSRRDLRSRQEDTEKLSDENRRIALTDVMSGLPNRRELLARFDRLEQLDQFGGTMGDCIDTRAVVFIDLDGFKRINDAHGHHVGDTLICRLSARLREICDGRAMVARVGGDEFAVLIETPGASAQAVALVVRF